MQPMRYIPIGHKIFISLLFITSFSGCILFNIDQGYDFDYKVVCKNATSDTLLITTSIEGGFISPGHLKGNILYPNSSLLYSDIGTMEGDDPIRELFSEWSGIDSCWLYKLDDEMREVAEIVNYTGNGQIYPNRRNLCVVWDAPLRNMGDAINHFFNYDSWEVIMEDDNSGIIQFTIREDDLECN